MSTSLLGQRFKITQKYIFKDSPVNQSINAKTLSALQQPIVGKTLLRSNGRALVMPCGYSGRTIFVKLSIKATAAQNDEVTVGRILGAKLAMHLEDCR